MSFLVVFSSFFLFIFSLSLFLTFVHWFPFIISFVSFVLTFFFLCVCVFFPGHIELVRIFIEAGSRLNALDSIGRTPAAWAASGGHIAGKKEREKKYVLKKKKKEKEKKIEIKKKEK